MKNKRTLRKELIRLLEKIDWNKYWEEVIRRSAEDATGHEKARRLSTSKL